MFDVDVWLSPVDEFIADMTSCNLATPNRSGGFQFRHYAKTLSMTSAPWVSAGRIS
jgi:hypothetical protein